MCKVKLSFVFFLSISLNTIQCRDVSRTETGRIVTTSLGDIQGELDSDGGYYKFLGIPYGQVSQANPFGVSSFMLFNISMSNDALKHFKASFKILNFYSFFSGFN